MTVRMGDGRHTRSHNWTLVENLTEAEANTIYEAVLKKFDCQSEGLQIVQLGHGNIFKIEAKPKNKPRRVLIQTYAEGVKDGIRKSTQF